MGTVGYMAPEQVSGNPGDARSDIFSLGCVLYETVTGQRAFSGRTGAETLAAILRDDPPEPAQSGRGIHPDLSRVISHCLQKKPEQRFQSARDLAFALRGIDLGSAPSVSQAEKPPRRRRFLLAGAALVVLVVLALLDVGGLRSRLLRCGGSRIHSLAVLPLQNLSNDPEQDYFADGLTEALIGDLAKIGSLRVISRTSVMSYKGTKKTLPQIARELNVDAVVEGSVLRPDNGFGSPRSSFRLRQTRISGRMRSNATCAMSCRCRARWLKRSRSGSKRS